LGFLAAAATAQLGPGDIAFVGFNADAPDNLAFVALKDIPANTRIYFCDANWNGTSFPSGEGDFSWTSSSVVPAGTVIALDSVDNGVRPSLGTIPHDNAGGISTSSEAFYAYLVSVHPDSVRKPSVFLAAVTNNNYGADPGVLAGTGLVQDSTAIRLRTAVDMAVYNGPRTRLGKAGMAAIADTANWLFEDGSGNESSNGIAPNLPFNTTRFTPLGPGDIAFTGWNADGVDNLAFVALRAIPANTRIYFCDSEWNGTGFGTDEGDFSWMSSTEVAAGTVVTINGLDSTSTVANIGSFPHDNSGGLGNSDEAMFAYLATFPDSVRKPLVFLTVASNGAPGAFGTLAGTGLTLGTTAAGIKTGADIAVYTGPRTLPDAASFLAALNDTTKWASQDSAGSQHNDGRFPDLPFSIAAFSFGVAGADTVKPVVTNVTVASATVLEVTFSELLDSASAVNLANYALNPVLSISSAIYNKALKKVTLTHAAFTLAANYVLQVSGVKDTSNNTMAAYGSASLVYNGVIPAISFDRAYYTVKETQSLMNVRLTASAAPSDSATVLIQVVNGGTAVAGADFTVSSQPFAWPKDSAGPRNWTLAVSNNSAAHPDRFFVLELKSPTGATLGAMSRTVVYILDDDTQAPPKSSELDLKFVSSYKVSDSAGASAEIVAYDSASKRLFAMNSTKDKLEILNFKNPRAIAKIAAIDLLAYGSGGTSVASKNGLVAVTIDAANFAPGKIVFLDTNGTVLKSVNAGSLPDMVTFSPDGKLVLAANEGQPSSDYATDPEGSVTVVDISGGIAGVSQSNVTTMHFNAFDAQKSALMAAGVRIFGLNNPTVSKDLEPEYVTVSEDSKTAWITLQENNAIAKADLTAKTITNIYPLGLKDHSLPRNSFDASDQLDSVFMGTWPVKGVYMPDAIANLKVGDTTYLFTANEGDAREYGSALVEEKKVGAADYKLDSLVFPNAAILKLNTNLGRLAVTGASGDLDADGDYDQIHAFGARSFSVWNGATGAQIWDSGNELEWITAKDSAYARLFNASNDNTAFKNRSDNKGPEPEGVAIGKIGNKAYAFIALERTGGVVAYEVTNPRAPRFVAWANNRSPVSATNDLGSEGIIFIPRKGSPNDTALVVLANEVSATVSVYSVRDTNSTTGLRGVPAAGSQAKFSLHPSPDGSLLFFSRPVDFKLSDALGKTRRAGKNAPWVDLKGLTRGRYFLAVPGVGSFSLMVTKK
jgi:hypothetical protein